MPIDTSARHRLLLSLRSEKAMGLRAVLGGVSVRQDVGADEVRQRVGVSVVEPQADVETDVEAGAESHETFDRVEAELSVKALPGAGSKFSVPVVLPVLKTEQKAGLLDALNRDQVMGCVKCRLCKTRTQTVFGEGDVDAKIFFIGEGPGQTEDETGRPFVGRAGQLLDKMIGAMGLKRSQVYIANIVKCRPPDNRVPAPDEVETCTPYLVKQLETVQPRVIVTLGLPSMKYMLENPRLTMGKMRGQWQSWRGIKLMPTYHPSYVLRAYTEANRKAVWDDLQLVMKEIGLSAKSKQAM